MVKDNENKNIVHKWKALLEGKDAQGEDLGFAPVKDEHKKFVTARLLENTKQELSKARAGQLNEDNDINNVVSGVDNFDPILINMVRRLAPNLMAYDMVGVQPMSGPTGLIFALRSFYGDQPQAPHGRPGDGRTGFQTGAELNTDGRTPRDQWGYDAVASGEAFYYEPDTTKAGTGTQTSNLTPPNYSTYSTGTGMATTALEALGTTSGGAYQEMSFTIDKKSVEAKGRALRASWSLELQQDLKAVHGLDAEGELSNILSTEITSEINREIINRIRMVAKISTGELQYDNGALVVDTNGDPILGDAGVFDLQSNTDGRWQNEKHKALLFKIGKEANKIAKETRRGRGNFIICSSDVAEALHLAGKMIYSPSIDDNLPADDTGNTFVGMLNGRYKVFVDPYLGYDEVIIGYKGASAIDAGMFYCPYVPLQMVKATDPNSFQPAMGYKTRYGIVENPMTTLERNANVYYRKFRVRNLG